MAFSYLSRRAGLRCAFASSLALVPVAAMLAGCSQASNSFTSGSGPGQPAASAAPLQHILFVGDSFTHGRYTPVRPYNSGGTEGTTGSNLVVDENYGQTGARAELEPGPWGGIPGMFAQFAVESGLNYDVHIEAISETALDDNYAAASSVIDQSKWNDVVLQDLSTRPLPYALSGDNTSDPHNFCQTVQTIEQGVHGAAPSANVYLYETWARADEANQLNSLHPNISYSDGLTALTTQYHDVYYQAAELDGNIAGVAPTGEAWATAWSMGIANPNPYSGNAPGPSLWYGMNATNNPSITSPDYIHPSIYGAYLSALVLFGQITGLDPRTLGSTESAASSLGISSTFASQLQQVAYTTLENESSKPIGTSSVNTNPCALTH